MFFTKFIYDLSGKPKPTTKELDDEINRLLFIGGQVGEPSFLNEWDERDQLGPLDSEILAFWLRRRFEPALVMLFLQSDENYARVKKELAEMGKYTSFIDKFLRINFVERRALQRLKELCFDDKTSNSNLQKLVIKLKRTLTLLSKQLDRSSSSIPTLQQTEAYTLADVTLYNYLKRIMVGRYKESGLKSHIKLCEPLLRFMSKYESKNPHVEPAIETTTPEEPTLISEMTKPALIAFGVILFFLWRKG